MEPTVVRGDQFRQEMSRNLTSFAALAESFLLTQQFLQWAVASIR